MDFLPLFLDSSDLPQWPWCNHGKRFSSHRRHEDHPLKGLSSYCRGNCSTYSPQDPRQCTISQSSQGQPDTALGKRGQMCKGATVLTILCGMERLRTGQGLAERRRHKVDWLSGRSHVSDCTFPFGKKKKKPKHPPKVKHRITIWPTHTFGYQYIPKRIENRHSNTPEKPVCRSRSNS